jgi:hypothetical protein
MTSDIRYGEQPSKVPRHVLEYAPISYKKYRGMYSGTCRLVTTGTAVRTDSLRQLPWYVLGYVPISYGPR